MLLRFGRLVNKQPYIYMLCAGVAGYPVVDRLLESHVILLGWRHSGAPAEGAFSQARVTL